MQPVFFFSKHCVHAYVQACVRKPPVWCGPLLRRLCNLKLICTSDTPPPPWIERYCPLLSVARFAGVATGDSRKHNISAPLQDCIVTAWQLRQVHSFQMSLLRFIFLLCFHVSVCVCVCVCACVWQQCGNCIFYLRLISMFFQVYNILPRIDSVVEACWVLWLQKSSWLTSKRLFFVLSKGVYVP